MKKYFFFFVIFFLGNNAFADNALFSLQECRSRIAEIICIVDPVDYNNPFANQYNRPCLNGGEKFEAIFQSHFDHSNVVIQKMYCSLEKIWIENSLNTTAYASPIYDSSNNLVAAGIGMKRDFLENPLKLNIWFSQKENSSFGQSVDFFKFSTDLTDKNFNAITYAINHEFGHIFDYANKINQYDDDCQLDINPMGCKPKSGSWGELSWLNAKVAKDLNQSQLLSALCFYNCHGEFLEQNKSKLLFEALFKTNFQSTYATINPKEDWAEAFALYLATKSSGLKLKVSTNGKEYDLTEHFLSDRLKSKREFIEKFLKHPVKYPGE